MPTTATITPTLGSAPVTLQAGNYSAIDDRRFWSANRTEGWLSTGSYKVIQRAAGANMTVDVQSATGDGAVVTGDSVTAQGRYFVPPTAANVNVDIAAADATNPRNDLVVLEVKDDQHDAGGLNLARVRVITGTPNASAALTDAFGVNGTPALPSSCMPLAVVRVAAGATSIATAAISDRRTSAAFPGAIVAAQTTWAGNSKTVSASNTDAVIASITFTLATDRYYRAAWGFDIFTSTNAAATIKLKNSSTDIATVSYQPFGAGGGTIMEQGSYVFTQTAGGSVTIDLVGRSSSATIMYFGSVMTGFYSIQDLGPITS